MKRNKRHRPNSEVLRARYDNALSGKYEKFARRLRDELHGRIKPTYPERPELKSIRDLLDWQERQKRQGSAVVEVAGGSVSKSQPSALEPSNSLPSVLPKEETLPANYFQDLQSLPEHIRRQFEE